MSERLQEGKSKSREIAALLCLALALLCGFFLWGAPAGVLGAFFRTLCFGLLGSLAYLLPVLILGLGIAVYKAPSQQIAQHRLLYALLLFWTLLALIALFAIDFDLLESTSNMAGRKQATEALRTLWQAGKNPELLGGNFWSGGLIGGLPAMGLFYLMGKVGSSILLLAMLIALSALVFNLSWTQTLKRTAKEINSTGRKVQQASRDFFERPEAPEPPRPEAGGSLQMMPPIDPKLLEADDFGNFAQPRTRQKIHDYDGIPNFDLSLSDQEAVERLPLEPLEEAAPVRPPSRAAEREAAPQLAEEQALRARAEALVEDTSHEAIEGERADWEDRSAGSSPKKKRIKAGQMSLFGQYLPPPLKLLNPERARQGKRAQDKEEIRLLGATLEQTLQDFGVDAKVVNFTTGPTISRFELSPGPGVKVSRIVGLSDDIALALAAVGLRIEAPIPGKSAIGIEIPNKNTEAVLLRGILESEAFKKASSALTAVLGRDIQGQPILCDLSKMPHLLVAGATGSGKSVCINSMLLSLLYRSGPEDLRLLMIDPKVVELSVYNGIPHLLQPVVTDPKKAYGILEWAVAEMTRRYGLFAENAVRDFHAYNDLVQQGQVEGEEKLPFILIVIDELSDLMATTPNEVEQAIARLTAMARAAGIHLIIATQRPSVDVITGVIKSNIPSRIAFSVASQVDSRTIIDTGGAEKLLGKGDMLYCPQSASKPHRGQGAFVTDAEVERVIRHLKNLYPEAYDETVAKALEEAGQPDLGSSQGAGSQDDPLEMEALKHLLEAGHASVSLLQRRLNVGYPRAARLIDILQSHGYVGPHEGSKPRKLLITAEEYADLQES